MTDLNLMARGRPQEFDYEEALEKAVHLFWEQGFEATGLRELLSHTGMARQSLYNTFGDKYSLFLKVIEQYEKTVAQRLHNQLNAPGSALENVRRVVRAWGCIELPNSSRGCLLVNTLTEFGVRDPEIAKRLRHYIECSVEEFYQALEQAKEVGELSEETDTRALARTLVNTRYGLTLLRKVQVEPAMLQDIVERSLAMLK
jgi:TetR/AcrR family transcriptional repressor of nem operon